MPAPGFGFSVGDFIAVAQLAMQIYQALNETRGARDQYKKTTGLLRSLRDALLSAFAVFYYPSSGESCPDISQLNGMRYELECCKQLMDDFWIDYTKYTQSLLDGRGNRFRSGWRKIKWILFKREDVETLQKNLEGHVIAFRLYTDAITWQRLEEIERRVVESLESNRRSEYRIYEILGILMNAHYRLPKLIGYPWEGGVTKDHAVIYFEDFLGRALTLPLMLCQSKDSFHKVVKIMFKDTEIPGRQRVIRKEYEVIEVTEGKIVGELDWEFKIHPGIRIALSILVQAPSIIGNETAISCYRCGAPYSRSGLGKGSLECFRCHLIITIIEKERIIELSSPLQGQGRMHSYDPAEKADPKRPPLVHRDSLKFEAPFKRIHYVQEVWKDRATDTPKTGESKVKKADVKENSTRLLLSAAECGDERMSWFLLDRGADPNAVSLDGRTALYLASCNGSEKIVKYLLDAGAEVRAPYVYSGLEALQAAYDGKHEAVARLLLQRLGETEELEVQVLATMSERLGEEHPETMRATSKLAMRYGCLGRWREAEELQRKLATTCKEKLGERHRFTMVVIANLAWINAKQGRLREAEGTGQQILGVDVVKLDKEHPFTLTSISNLDLTYANMGQWDGVKKLEAQVLEFEEEGEWLLGEEDLDTLASTDNLMQTLEGQGLLEESNELEAQLRKLLEGSILEGTVSVVTLVRGQRVE